MIDRTGQVWETASGEIWLVTSTSPPEDKAVAAGMIARHDTLILASRVKALEGRASWQHERTLWETRSSFRRLA